ncbi:peptidoglycan/LPS O-acetylase OafA/YrhL [Enterococcus sp. PF1-24]|uniref:acyltransferase family protein n=1 Tax=unclassified Enterococcus TaxID=2608891 RepID=UPI0024772675|nr:MULTISPECIES: acyltransferase family protein [unclassified Enterococcus]MDH6363855.1 peptidoglycan/LPS O-acetylase OafA/YrhL [Enterococcus sp. PFB1-1]MDH6400959.1 peptidoglycan/LPS O-acetylase OafA/YrhL [Enterococcus sp. PF1-24]
MTKNIKEDDHRDSALSIDENTTEKVATGSQELASFKEMIEKSLEEGRRKRQELIEKETAEAAAEKEKQEEIANQVAEAPPEEQETDKVSSEEKDKEEVSEEAEEDTDTEKKKKKDKEDETLKRRYITGLNGVRSVAVIGVILYHLLPSSMKGGYLGVPIFFVVSGYLLTDGLLRQWDNNKKIDLKNLYFRRMKRLYPSLLAMFLMAISYMTLFQRNLLRDIRQIVASSLLWVNNWWQINNGLSYFDRFGNESPFTHIWSLAVESQHFLIWPLIFILLKRFLGKRSKMFYATAGLAVISGLLMLILYKPGVDPSRVYYGTDTRVFSLLLGGALGMVWPSDKIKEKISKEARAILNAIGIAALIIVILGLLFLKADSTFVYYGGMFLYSVVCCVLVAITAHPGASLGKWLTNPVFDWLGKRSYGIYLYQFPVMIFYEAKVRNINNLLGLHIIIELVLILGISELSYRFIEEPFRHMDYRQTWQDFKVFIKKPKFSKTQLVSIPIIAMTVLSLVGLVIAPTKASVEQEALQQKIAENKKLAEASKKQDAEKQSNIAGIEDPENLYGLPPEKLAIAANMQISGFGDSLMLATTNELQNIFPNIVVDGDIGRQLIDSAPLISNLVEEDQLRDAVIVSLGANGPFSEEEFDGVMAAFGDRQIFWVNLYVPTQRWETEVNAMLTKMNEKYANLTLIDWHDYSRSHPEWFYEDRVHPNEAGSVAYAGLVARTILKDK